MKSRSSRPARTIRARRRDRSHSCRSKAVPLLAAPPQYAYCGADVSPVGVVDIELLDVVCGFFDFLCIDLLVDDELPMPFESDMPLMLPEPMLPDDIAPGDIAPEPIAPDVPGPMEPEAPELIEPVD